jgi:hypothetical protein
MTCHLYLSSTIYSSNIYTNVGNGHDLVIDIALAFAIFFAVIVIYGWAGCTQ